MKGSIIREIAKQNGVKASDVRRDMQAAINTAYTNPNTLALSVHRKGDIPTPEEFVDYCVLMFKAQYFEMAMQDFKENK